MSSLPRRSVWSSHAHPWHKMVGTYQTGLHRVSGENALLVSEGHHGYRNGGGPDNGGNFSLRRNDYYESSNYALDRVTNSVESYPILRGDFGTSYQGNQFAYYSGVVPGESPFWGDSRWPCPDTTDDQLYGLGTTYIAKVLPTNPVADLATFIGELRQGLPKMGIETFRKRASTARSAGGDYLNYEFGWKPLVNDLKKFSKAVTKQDDILRQYERNSGKVVKRKRTFTDTKTVEVFTWTAKPYPDPYFWISYYVNPGVMTLTVTRKVRRWFSGSFTYYVLPENGINRGLWSSKANKLYGARLTPETLWNLTPWSWALDWVGNTGDVLKNVAAFSNDGLVMPYAYVMEETSTELRFELNGVTYNRIENAGAGPYSFEQTFVTTTKRRLKATPYGFGLNPDVDFTSRQKAIIAALGLSKSGKRK